MTDTKNKKTKKTKEKEIILLAHGSGGKLSHDLISRLFLPTFDNSIINKLNDSAVLKVGNQRLAFTTDSYVVDPIFFPGGNIGNLAVHGTVNDLAMVGARPLYLSLGLKVRASIIFFIYFRFKLLSLL